jgi:hypothetical protein
MPSLSNEQLLQSMEGEIFEVTLPRNLTSEDSAGLAVLRPDGKIEHLTDSTGWDGIRKVKVICFPREQGGFRWVFFYQNMSLRGRLPNFPKNLASSINGNRNGISPGQRLIRFSEDGSVNDASPLPTGDDFDLIFYVGKRK